MRRASSGSLGRAWLTRFCTATCALSKSVPSLKVTVSAMTPSDVACEEIYRLLGTPLIACSNGLETVSAIVLGLAPG